mgnify:CR=1 FL=1
MIRIDREAILPFSAEQMFRLVEDIETYPQFLSSCTGSKILSRDGNQIEAELCLSKSGFEQCFSTRNTNLEFESIKLELLDGPFTSLLGEWSFTDFEGLGCKVEFHLTFEMKRSLFQKMISQVVVEASNRLVDAICQRADEIYNLDRKTEIQQ